eukprot:TRINITY_DN32848_c0_g1_i1.p1 TRINITY_DN32848_c0_g1~~TRINITY_DN32848_c0_g1_i1.p1  ORF type:complete len:558 (-),score=55.10 TRINITY_DN32848_c0_g1_i1:251-1924(-)
MRRGVAKISLALLLSSLTFGDLKDAAEVHGQLTAIQYGTSQAVQLFDEVDEGECTADAVPFLQRSATVAIKGQNCLIAKLLIPPAVLCSLGAVMLFVVFRSILVAGHDPADFVLSLGVFNSFQENMLFTIVLVHAFGFMHSLGGGAVSSGGLIGTHKIGTSFGTVVMCMGFHMKPDLSRFSQAILLLGAWLQIVSAVTFGALGFATLERIQVKLPVDIVLKLLFAARFFQGFGGGLQISLAWNQVAHIASDRRGVQNMRVFVGGCLGLGAGPLIISAASWVTAAMPCSCRLDSRLMLPLVAALPLMQLAVLLPLGIPSLEGVPTVGEQAIAIGEKQRCWKLVVVLICICMHILRNLTVAALEAGVSMLFETKYGWSKGSVGLGTSAVVFAALPVQLIFERLKPIMAQQTWTIVMLWASLTASCFLSVRDDKMLLGASMVLFPLMALSSGLIMGKMQDHALPRGSLLDLNTSTLLGMTIADFAGRGGGPIAARWSISRLGQGGFAGFLVGCCGATTLLYHITLCISYHWQDSHKESEQPSQSYAPLAPPESSCECERQ